MLLKHMQLYFAFRKQLAARIFEKTSSTVPVECPIWVDILKSLFKHRLFILLTSCLLKLSSVSEYV